MLQESLETFVEIDRFRGACYRAANWMQVGITQGRCKLEKSMQGKLPKKYILLYPLVKDFKEQPCSLVIDTSERLPYMMTRQLDDSYHSQSHMSRRPSEA